MFSSGMKIEGVIAIEIFVSVHGAYTYDKLCGLTCIEYIRDCNYTE